MSGDTTVTVRGVDLETWKEFQKSIIDIYGNLYGYVGPELTKALKLWLEKSGSGTAAVRTKRQPGKTAKEMIREALTSLGGEATIQEVTGYIRDKYGLVNVNSISTDMSDLSINGPKSSLYPASQRFLERVSRGRYRVLKRGAT
jgi:hypothetical protein